MRGENREALVSYFGDELYRQLRDLAGDLAGRRRGRGARVLILPGILGSTIGTRNGDVDTLWLDPVSIAKGDLAKIRWGAEGEPSGRPNGHPFSSRARLPLG